MAVVFLEFAQTALRVLGAIPAYIRSGDCREANWRFLVTRGRCWPCSRHMRATPSATSLNYNGLICEAGHSHF
jgi:hypothetical protein